MHICSPFCRTDIVLRCGSVFKYSFFFFWSFPADLPKCLGTHFSFVVSAKPKRGVAQMNSSGFGTSHQFIKIALSITKTKRTG